MSHHDLNHKHFTLISKSRFVNIVVSSISDVRTLNLMFSLILRLYSLIKCRRNLMKHSQKFCLLLLGTTYWIYLKSLQKQLIFLQITILSCYEDHKSIYPSNIIQRFKEILITKNIIYEIITIFNINMHSLCRKTTHKKLMYKMHRNV